MKINSIEKLEDLIVQDISWRKREMKNFELQVNKFGNLVYSEPMILRSAVSILCAHWEGFVRSASNYYVVYIISCNHTYNQLNDCFFALSMEKKIKQEDAKKINPYIRILEEIKNKKANKFHIRYVEPDKRIITTDGNLSYSKFKDILNRIGLPNEYEKYKEVIEEDLLKNRHAIVHGERVTITKSEYLSLHQLVLELIDLYKENIIEAAEKQAYLK